MCRKYQISGLTSQATRELTFPVDDQGTMKSVVQYFQETYGFVIQHTTWPCLQVGHQQRPNYLPMELQGKRVKLLDLYGDVVAVGIVMSIDKERVVMGRELGTSFCEVSVIFVTKPDAPLVVKDHHRKQMKDAVGSHIPWLIDCVKIDLSRRQILQEDA